MIPQLPGPVFGASRGCGLRPGAIRTALDPGEVPRAAARGRPGHAGRLDPRSRTDRLERRRIRHRPAGSLRMTAIDLQLPRRLVEEDRQRPPCPRPRQVHPLPQVRRRPQRPAAEHLRHRRRGPRLRLPYLHGARRAPHRLGMRVLRELHRGVPDGGAVLEVGVRHACVRHLGRVGTDADPDRVRVPRRRLQPHTAVQENEIVEVTSPRDDPVTHGNLCIKGRFGYRHVQNRV